MAETKKTATKPAIQRTPAESLAFSMGNTIRWEMQAALHTGERSASELARLVGLTRHSAKWHIKQLEESGCIELAETTADNQRIYRAVRTDAYTDEEFAALSVEARREHHRLILMWLAAEMFAAWQGGTMLDSFTALVWDWAVQLDEHGREEWKAERERHRAAKDEIRVRSLERLAHSGEKPVTIVYADLDFVRSGRVSEPPFRRRD
jgi:DNA-binding Lrp family transcriptional regulator